jgi:hypothetical protein
MKGSFWRVSVLWIFSMMVVNEAIVVKSAPNYGKGSAGQT